MTRRHLAELRYRTSFETNPAPTLIARLTDEVLVDSNEGFAELYGRPKEETNGRSLADLGLLSKEYELREVFDRLRDGEKVEQRQTQMARGLGKCEVIVAARPIELAGEECGIFTFIDITELRRTQRLLRESAFELAGLQEEVDSISFSVSHDLRTPLRGIHGFSEALLQDFGTELGETGRRYLDRVKAGATRMGELIDSLLLLSHLRRWELRLEELNISAMAQWSADSLRSHDPNRKADFDIAPGIVATADRELAWILLHNLFDNAWKFTRNESEARIEFGREDRGGKPVFFVRDNGVGFDRRFAGRLFEPFQRVHRQEDVEGLGVGLAAAARVVQRHGGEIWAESEPGSGATFYFTLATDVH